MGCRRPAQLTLAETRPPGKCKCPSFGARGLGWVRFPALKNVSRDSGPILAASSRRPGNVRGTTKARGREGRQEGRGGRAPRGSGPVLSALGAADHRLVCTETCLPWETEAAAGRAGRGGNIGKRNWESQKMFRTKGGTILRLRRRSLVSKRWRPASWLWILQRVYCVGSQAESGSMKKWGGGESTVEGKSVPRRLRMAGKCHQGECSGIE